MEGILGKIGSILRLSKNTNARNNRSFQARNIEGPVTVDQSTKTYAVSTSEGSSERKRGAADGIWKAILELKREAPTAPFIIDLTVEGEDDAAIEGNLHFQEALREIKRSGFDKQLAILTAAEEHKRYVSDRLWGLFHAYGVLTIRPALLLRDKGIKSARKWRTDTIIRKAMAAEFMPEGIRTWNTSGEAPLMRCKKAIEAEVMEEIRLLERQV